VGDQALPGGGFGRAHLAVSRYAIDALLRPPVELWSAWVAIAVAGIAMVAPAALMMPATIADALSVSLLLFAGWRCSQAFRVLRYQRRLSRMPRYRLKIARIPCSRSQLFLGRGFQWTQQHTQRLRDTYRPEVQRYVRPGLVY